MNELVEFLRARLDEDEAAAKRAAAVASRWVDAGSLLLGLTEEPNIYELDFAAATNYRYDDALTHAARHDPDRVLADVQAKRRIMDEHMPTPVDAVAWEDDQEAPYGCRTCAFSSEEGVRGWGYCLTLKLLALPHAGHEHYRDKWRP